MLETILSPIKEQAERISSLDPVERVLSLSAGLVDMEAGLWQVGRHSLDVLVLPSLSGTNKIL